MYRDHNNASSNLRKSNWEIDHKRKSKSKSGRRREGELDLGLRKTNLAYEISELRKCLFVNNVILNPNLNTSPDLFVEYRTNEMDGALGGYRPRKIEVRLFGDGEGLLLYFQNCFQSYMIEDMNKIPSSLTKIIQERHSLDSIL